MPQFAYEFRELWNECIYALQGTISGYLLLVQAACFRYTFFMVIQEGMKKVPAFYGRGRGEDYSAPNTMY